MNTRKQSFFITLLLALVLAVPASLITASPAQADDTILKIKCGVNIPWGPYCGATYTKTQSNRAKEMLVRGASVADVGLFLCLLAPGIAAKAVCIAAITKNKEEFRDAINNAKASPGKCVHARVYSSGISNLAARTIMAKDCVFPSCVGGDGGGGCSWKPVQYVISEEMEPAVGGGGGSW